MPGANPIWEAFHKGPKHFKSNQNHYECWCRECINLWISTARSREILASAGQPLVPQKSDAEWLELALATNPALCGRVETMRAHLLDCVATNAHQDRRQSRDALLVRAQAATTKASRRVPSEPRHSSLPPQFPHHNSYSMPPPTQFQLPSFQNTQYPLGFSPPSTGAPPSPAPYMHSPSPSLPPLSPVPGFSGLQYGSEREFMSPIGSSSSSLFADTVPPPKRRRTTSTSSYGPAWSAENQDEFDTDLCNLFVSCGWSWYALQNPELVGFFKKYVPFASLPDRRKLSGPVLEREAGKVIGRVRQEVNGKLATYATDGWTNIARTHVNTSVLSVEADPYLLRTHDMTGRPKTGDELYTIVTEDLEYAKETYGVDVVAICTDDGPDGKKMRRLIKERSPWIAAFECWAHQAHLITGNYLAIKAPWMAAAKLAIEVIKFFNHHQTPLDYLRAQELQTMGHFLALLLPVLTRWLSQYVSIRRLKRLERQILAVVVAYEDKLRVCLGKTPEQIATAEHVITTVKDPAFWSNLERIGNHLEPLAIASNILQAPYCRLDMVLLTLGNLYRIFKTLPTTETQVTAALHGSLERRWAKTDQELMILAIFLNPFIRTRAFNTSTLPPITFFHLVRRVFKRLMRQDADGDTEFFEAFNSYFDNNGYFSDENMWLNGHRKMYEESNKHVELVPLWRRMDSSGSLRGRAGFVALAVRILSILPNSAGPERVFSDFGIIHAKRRNRLNPQKVHNTSLVRAERRRIHAAAGLIPKRKMRHCSLAQDQEEIAAEEEESVAGRDDPDEGTINNDFERMANILINLATEESRAPGDDSASTPSLPHSTASSNTASGSAATTINPTDHVPAYKKIPLEKLFVYPPAGTEAANLEFFWRVGRAGVEEEEEEMARAQAENTVTTTPVAGDGGESAADNLSH